MKLLALSTMLFAYELISSIMDMGRGCQTIHNEAFMLEEKGLMHMDNKSLATEKILLGILDMASDVYYSSNKEDCHFYFYPKGLGATVYVTCELGRSMTMYLKFTSRNKDDESVEHKVAYSIGNFQEIPHFTKELYRKHESMLNMACRLEEGDHEKHKNFILDILSCNEGQLKARNVVLQGQGHQLTLKAQMPGANIAITLGRTIYNYEHSGNELLPPLTPVVIDTIIEDHATSSKELFKIVVPYHEAGSYPMLNFLPPLQSHDDLGCFVNAVKQRNPAVGAKLAALCLDAQLEKKKTKLGSKPKV